MTPFGCPQERGGPPLLAHRLLRRPRVLLRVFGSARRRQRPLPRPTPTTLDGNGRVREVTLLLPVLACPSPSPTPTRRKDPVGGDPLCGERPGPILRVFFRFGRGRGCRLRLSGAAAPAARDAPWTLLLLLLGCGISLPLLAARLPGSLGLLAVLLAPRLRPRCLDGGVFSHQLAVRVRQGCGQLEAPVGLRGADRRNHLPRKRLGGIVPGQVGRPEVILLAVRTGGRHLLLLLDRRPGLHRAWFQGRRRLRLSVRVEEQVGPGLPAAPVRSEHSTLTLSLAAAVCPNRNRRASSPASS